VFENRHAPELREANCHPRLSYSKQLLKKYSSSDVSIISFADQKVSTVAAPKNFQDDQPYALAATKKKRRDKMPAYTQ